MDHHIQMLHPRRGELTGNKLREPACRSERWGSRLGRAVRCSSIRGVPLRLRERRQVKPRAAASTPSPVIL